MGNRLPFWAWAQGSGKGNKKYKMIDVFFAPVSL